MRILHTSDWHLGRSFHRVDLLPAQAAFADHLVEVVRAEQVDVVVVAGDVYDRALPGVEAVRLLDDTLFRLVGAGATVILSSGNHDSPRRLGFGSRLLEQARLYVRTDPSALATPVLLEDEHGPVAFYPLPYLEPTLTADALGAERTHPAVLAAAMDAVRQDLRPRNLRSVVTAHAFVTGGEASDSERELAVGGLGQVGTSVFAGASYVALGHLHGRQRLGETVRYSGSPLAFSFSEADHRKGSWLVTLGPDGVESVEAVDAPVPRPLARLRGTLTELLTEARFAPSEGAWCQITLTDGERPANPMEQLRGRFPHVLELRSERTAGALTPGGYTARIAGQTDHDVCCSFLDHVRGRAADVVEGALLAEALEGVLLQQVEGVAGPEVRAGRRTRHDVEASDDLVLDLDVSSVRHSSSGRYSA